MKKSIKKLVSVLLAALIVFTVAAPATAVAWNAYSSQIPIVQLFGDGQALYAEDGTKLLAYRDILGKINSDKEESDEEKDNSEIYKATANILLPFLIEGLGTGNYDNYYKNLQKEIGDLFEGILLDNNGNVSNGSGINPANLVNMERDLSQDKKIGKGYYDARDYTFSYDWRLDPLEVADTLHTYIERVKAVTGSKEVCLIGRCLGSSVITAYVAKYGMEGIHGVGFDGGVVNGAEVISEPISGKFKLDGNALNRFLADCNALGMFKVDSFINETIDLLSKAGVFETVAGVTKETIYYTVVKGVTSALALSTFFTFPSYWAAVKSEDYEEAKEYVFGPEGSEKRQEYSGLIAKLDNYNEKVRQKIPEIMDTINDNGNLAVIAKYGVQIVPVIKSRNVIGDQFASVECASYGATASDVYSTLSDEYIAQRVAEGKGKYISPDKQIDASTCQFPDQTWFVKGAKHSQWTQTETDILCTVISADRQLTVDESPLSQFIVYKFDESKAYQMTEENCDTYYWKANKQADQPESKASRLMFFLFALARWFMSLINRIRAK